MVAGSQGSIPHKQHALSLVKGLLVKDDDDRQKGLALLAEGTALYKLVRLDQAAVELEKAVVRFRKAGAAKERAYAQDGLAIVAISQQRWEDARASVKSALEALQDYDSAAFHGVEIDDEMSRRFLGGYDPNADQNDLKAVCDADRRFRTSQAAYDAFISHHPSFSVAYTQLATARVIRLNFIGRKGTPPVGCPGKPSSETLQQSMEEAKRSLQDAVAEDPQNPTSWFQSAILKYELQDPQFKESVQGSLARLTYLRQSQEDFRNAVNLNGVDYYMWFRFGEMLFALHGLDDVTSREKIVDEARNAFCDSIRFNTRNDEGHYREAMAYLAALKVDCHE